MGSGDGDAFANGPHTAAQWRARLAQGQVQDPNGGPPVFKNADGYQPSPNDIIPDAPPVVDLTDVAVRRAALAQRRRLMAGSNIDASFLTGPLGAGPATGAAPTATGGG